MNKKKVIFLLIILLGNVVFANDTYFFSSGGSIVPVDEKDSPIQMQEEEIKIILNEDHYEVTVDFQFYNDGDEIELLVGFPFFEVGIGGHSKIYDFKCWTNGVQTDYKEILFDRDYSNRNNKAENLEYANTRKITFAKKQITRTKISYKSKYGRDTRGYIINYLYGTGSSWKNSIGKIVLTIENNISLKYPDEFKLPTENATFERIADNKWTAIFYDIEPNPDFSEDLLSDIEKSNVKTLLEEEKSRDVYK